MTKYDVRIARAREALRSAGAVLVGGGSGLSDAAGLKYAGRRFAEHFAPFIGKYGLTDMYSSTFFPFPTAEERWAYWARHIAVNRHEPPALPLYRELRRLVEGRAYFVVTTNVDHQFRKAGFAEDRIFGVQGDYGQLQCAARCHDKLYENEPLVRAMLDATVDCRVPPGLVPWCPVCAGPMVPHLRVDERFIEGPEWQAAAQRYVAFVREARRGPIALLELGVGFNTPGIIRLPFERLVTDHLDARLIRVNAGHPCGPKEIESRIVSFGEDMARVVNDLVGS